MFRKIFITMLLAAFCTSAFSQPGRKDLLHADITQLTRKALLSGAITQNQADSITHVISEGSKSEAELTEIRLQMEKLVLSGIETLMASLEAIPSDIRSEVIAAGKLPCILDIPQEKMTFRSMTQQEAQERIHTLVAESKKSFYSYSSLDTWQLIAIYILRIFMGGTSGADPSLRYAPIRNGRILFLEPGGLREFDESVFLESAFDPRVYSPSKPLPLYDPTEYGNGASR